MGNGSNGWEGAQTRGDAEVTSTVVTEETLKVKSFFAPLGVKAKGKRAKGASIASQRTLRHPSFLGIAPGRLSLRKERLLSMRILGRRGNAPETFRGSLWSNDERSFSKRPGQP
jgi:hypothetical protein